MLEGYEVTLPDKSVGSLADFYAGIMDESIQATDAGYVLSDGTLVPTQGEAMWNPDADFLIALMSPYISGGEGTSTRSVPTDTPPPTEDEDLPPIKANFSWKWVGIAALAIFGYKEFVKK